MNLKLQTSIENARLMEFWRAKRGQNEHRPLYASKRHIKCAGLGVGSVLKNRYVKGEHLSPERGLNAIPKH